jgi:hypothetical protein
MLVVITDGHLECQLRLTFYFPKGKKRKKERTCTCRTLRRPSKAGDYLQLGYENDDITTSYCHVAATIKKGPSSKGVKFLRNFTMFQVGIFLVGNLVRKVSTNWWNLFHTAKSGKYHSPKKTTFSIRIITWILLVGNLVRKVSTNWWNLFYTAKSGKYHSPEKHPFPLELSLYNPVDSCKDDPGENLRQSVDAKIGAACVNLSQSTAAKMTQVKIYASRWMQK